MACERHEGMQLSSGRSARRRSRRRSSRTREVVVAVIDGDRAVVSRCTRSSSPSPACRSTPAGPARGGSHRGKPRRWARRPTQSPSELPSPEQCRHRVAGELAAASGVAAEPLELPELLPLEPPLLPPLEVELPLELPLPELLPPPLPEVLLPPLEPPLPELPPSAPCPGVPPSPPRPVPSAWEEEQAAARRTARTEAQERVITVERAARITPGVSHGDLRVLHEWGSRKSGRARAECRSLSRGSRATARREPASFRGRTRATIAVPTP